jgi:hypothetical protein
MLYARRDFILHGAYFLFMLRRKFFSGTKAICCSFHFNGLFN